MMAMKGKSDFVVDGSEKNDFVIDLVMAVKGKNE